MDAMSADDGLCLLQDAMRAAEKKSTEDCPVKMKLVAPPLYVLTTNVSAGSARFPVCCACSAVVMPFACSELPHHVYLLQLLITYMCDLTLVRITLVLIAFLCGCQTLEKAKGIEVLKEACAACAEAILTHKGRMIVKDEARVVCTLSFSMLSDWKYASTDLMQQG